MRRQGPPEAVEAIHSTKHEEMSVSSMDLRPSHSPLPLTPGWERTGWKTFKWAKRAPPLPSVDLDNHCCSPYTGAKLFEVDKSDLIVRWRFPENGRSKTVSR